MGVLPKGKLLLWATSTPVGHPCGLPLRWVVPIVGNGLPSLYKRQILIWVPMAHGGLSLASIVDDSSTHLVLPEHKWLVVVL